MSSKARRRPSAQPERPWGSRVKALRGMDVQRLRPESRRHNTQGEQLVLPFILATGIENSAPLIAAHGQARYRVDEPAKTRHYERWRDQL